MIEHPEVVQLADTIHAVCAGKPINVTGPALVLALHAALAETGVEPEHRALIIDELHRRLLRMNEGEKLLS